MRLIVSELRNNSGPIFRRFFDVETREEVKEYHLTDEDWKRVYEIREEYFLATGIGITVNRLPEN